MEDGEGTGGGDDWRRHLQCVVCLEFVRRPIRLLHWPPDTDCGVVFCATCHHQWSERVLPGAASPPPTGSTRLAPTCPRCRADLMDVGQPSAGAAHRHDALLARLIADLCPEDGDDTTAGPKTDSGGDLSPDAPPPQKPGHRPKKIRAIPNGPCVRVRTAVCPKRVRILEPAPSPCIAPPAEFGPVPLAWMQRCAQAARPSRATKWTRCFRVVSGDFFGTMAWLCGTLGGVRAPPTPGTFHHRRGRRGGGSRLVVGRPRHHIHDARGG